jgi:hypothetical protein
LFRVGGGILAGGCSHLRHAPTWRVHLGRGRGCRWQLCRGSELYFQQPGQEHVWSAHPSRTQILPQSWLETLQQSCRYCSNLLQEVLQQSRQYRTGKEGLIKQHILPVTQSKKTQCRPVAVAASHNYRGVCWMFSWNVHLHNTIDKVGSGGSKWSKINPMKVVVYFTNN